ncbi:MAG: hypothetical protein HZB54_07040 [Deltaproteobacteria bacterium]|nr:hypothetical protein [Deltaproteobacteria bacterium]
MKIYAVMIVILVVLGGFISCNKQEEKKETGRVEEKKEAKTAEEVAVPAGHPPVSGTAEHSMVTGRETADGAKKGSENIDELAVGHPSGGDVKRDVRVPDEVKSKWKTISLKLLDKEKKTESQIIAAVGKETPIKGTKLAIKVVAFLPHYTMYDTYISSKSNEPLNPAVLVELLERGKGVAKGWVFANFTTFNSYKHARYEIVLPAISSPR